MEVKQNQMIRQIEKIEQGLIKHEICFDHIISTERLTTEQYDAISKIIKDQVVDCAKKNCYKADVVGIHEIDNRNHQTITGALKIYFENKYQKQIREISFQTDDPNRTYKVTIEFEVSVKMLNDI